jgi:hypothetical protein
MAECSATKLGESFIQSECEVSGKVDAPSRPLRNIHAEESFLAFAELGAFSDES